MKKKPESNPEDPRQRIRIYRDGLHFLMEFFIEPGQKIIDLDLYTTFNPDFTLHMNYPAESVKE